MEFDKALEILADNIKKYRQMEQFNGDELLTILQQIVGTLHYLEGQRSEAHKTWTARVNKLILEGSTVARAECQANEEIPELYLLRHVMNSAYKTAEAIRSTLSWLRNEKGST